jgi:hypothetical protein
MNSISVLIGIVICYLVYFIITEYIGQFYPYEIDETENNDDYIVLNDSSYALKQLKRCRQRLKSKTNECFSLRKEKNSVNNCKECIIQLKIIEKSLSECLKENMSLSNRLAAANAKVPSLADALRPRIPRIKQGPRM